jgi:hypothetical protein
MLVERKRTRKAMPKQAIAADIRKGLAVLYETPRTRITRGIFIGAKRQGRSKFERESRWDAVQTGWTTVFSGRSNNNTPKRTR